MGIKKGKAVEKLESKRELLFDEAFTDKNFLYKEFNQMYSKFCDISDSLEDNEENLEIVECGKRVAFLIAYEFDFKDEEISSKKKEYVTLARDILYFISSNPYNDPEALIYLIRALYGQTNIGYNNEGEYKLTNIQDGNEWVDYIERNTKDRVLKAYAITLRAFQFMLNGKELGMKVKDILKKVEKELLYATKWDEDNFLAFYCLGLLYMDEGNSKYNPKKAIDNFNKTLEFKNKKVRIENYLINGEKEKAMNNSKKKIEKLSL